MRPSAHSFSLITFLTACASPTSAPAATTSTAAIPTAAPTAIPAPTTKPTGKTDPIPQPTAVPSLVWMNEGVRLKPAGEPVADVSAARLQEGQVRLCAFAHW